MRSPFTALLLLAAPLLAGCPNTDAAVFVDPSIESPVVAVTSSVLNTGVAGSFTLKLHLGARASGPSQVNIGQFSIMDASMKTALVTPLALDAGSTQLPVTVAQDSDVTVALGFDDLFEKDLAGALCDPAGIVVSGTIEDSLQNTATPVDSAIFHPTGCP